MAREFVRVDPRTLRLPTIRLEGADPDELQLHIARHGTSLTGMLPILVYRDPDGELMITDGVTRATRAAMYHPGVQIVVEVMGKLRGPFRSLPTVEEKLP